MFLTSLILSSLLGRQACQMQKDSLLDPFVVVKKRVISTDIGCPKATLADFVFFVYRELCMTTGA